jgi:hypothetical protein
MDLLSHVRGDDDLIPAWLEHYRRLGVTTFHVIVHGPASENTTLRGLAGRYPIVVEDAYDAEFISREKERRLNEVLARLRGRWFVMVDSDEFLELPYDGLAPTIAVLQRLGADALYAPMLQRVRADFSLATPETLADPFQEMPLCSVSLYRDMGSQGSIDKYPLFFNQATTVVNGGAHLPPNREATVLSRARGVTHHFKWRRSAIPRLEARVASQHKWRHESAAYLAYLEAHDGRLPRGDAFVYSREALFRRHLLRRVGVIGHARWAAGWLASRGRRRRAAAPPPPAGVRYAASAGVAGVPNGRE